MNCPICGKEILASDKRICRNPKCILFLQSHSIVEAIASATAAAEKRGWERAREMAAKYLDREAAAMYMIDTIRAMQPQEPPK